MGILWFVELFVCLFSDITASVFESSWVYTASSRSAHLLFIGDMGEKRWPQDRIGFNEDRPEMVEIPWMKCDDSGRTIIETNVEETRCD